MVETELRLPTYRYVITVDDEVVSHGFTTDLTRRLKEIQVRWPSAQIEQVGAPTTHKEAYRWEHSHLPGTDPRSPN